VSEECRHCAETIPAVERSCPVCGQDAGFPNVRRAERLEESAALLVRLEDAYKAATARRSELQLKAFESAVDGSEAVMNRSLGALLSWTAEGGPLLTTFHSQVRAGARLLQDNQWDEQRISAENTINPRYFEDLNLSALCLDRTGMQHYGPYAVTLKTSLISYRTSVFEENPFLFNRRHTVYSGDKCPVGYRATWENRSKLAAAKLAPKINQDTTNSHFPAMLLAQDTTNAGDDDFIEVHTYGPLHQRTIQHVMGMVEVLKELRQFPEANTVLDSAVRDFPLNAGLASLRAGLLMRQSRYEDALQAYDNLIAHFPFHALGRKNRADVIRRMGQFDHALVAYESILKASPDFFPARLARLSLLIELGRSDEALLELPAGQPKSEPEWQLYFLRAVATEALYGGKAIPLFNYGVRNAPFAKQRRLFAAALGRNRLLNGKFSKSLEVIESQEGEVSNVIWLHALAASGRKAKAKTTFDHIVANETNSAIVELSQEIASRYKVVAFPSKRSREWIFAAEHRQLLLEAA
jgi:tetratricopeptide (TPR) repeat protein